MLKNNELYMCRVCGAEQLDLPWGEDGETPTYNICACCGVEFGYEDYTLIALKNYRIMWVNKGANWFCKKEKPDNWVLEEQLHNIPKKYL